MRSHPMPEFGSFALLLALVLSAYTLVAGALGEFRDARHAGDRARRAQDSLSYSTLA